MSDNASDRPARLPDDDPARDPEAPGQPDTRAGVDPQVAELLGLRPEGAGSMPDANELDTLGQMTDTRIYEGDLEARPPDSDQPDEGQAANLESLVDDELRAGETDDANEAAEEGLAWVPPIDPPLRVGEHGPEVAAGFGTTAQDEPFDADHHSEPVSPLDEMEARVAEALEADSATAGLVDALEVDAEGGTIRVAGVVPDIVDEDAVVAVIEHVAGVIRVDSRLQVAAVAETEARERP